MAVKQIKHSEFTQLCKKHWPSIMEVEFTCPHFKTVQTGNDLVKAGAGKDFNEVQGYIGFSCIGRFDETKGCNWTLGGLFGIHKLEIVDDNDSTKTRMCFEINPPKDKIEEIVHA